MNEVTLKEDIKIENLIYEIRGSQVMLDSDLAKLYDVETKQLNRQVKRNIERFDEDFMFKLTNLEYQNLKCQIGTSSSNNYGGRRNLPYVFTEMGVATLASILHSDVAVEMSKRIIRAFVFMRKYISTNLLEQKYINNQVMKNAEDIKLLKESFSKFDEKRKTSELFFDGQIYDAYSKIKEIFNMAKSKLIIIDSYADSNILDIIKELKIDVIIITKENMHLKEKDIINYNKQYNNLKVYYDETFHDRYFILDNKDIYLSGASVNRIGYKTSTIVLLNDKDMCNLLIDKVNKIIENKN